MPVALAACQSASRGGAFIATGNKSARGCEGRKVLMESKTEAKTSLARSEEVLRSDRQPCLSQRLVFVRAHILKRGEGREAAVKSLCRSWTRFFYRALSFTAFFFFFLSFLLFLFQFFDPGLFARRLTFLVRWLSAMLFPIL